MAIALVQSNEGLGTTATTTASFSVAPTSGNLVVLCFASDDYNGTPNTGWTQSTGMEQQGFHGSYVWWRISDGSNSLQYTINSASPSVWVLMEFSGVHATPYDISDGTIVNTSGSSYALPTIIPTTGNRLLVGSYGASNANDVSAYAATWSNSFTKVQEIGASTGTTKDFVSTAYRLVTGDGSTGYTTTPDHTGSNVESRSGLIVAFKEAAGGSPYSVVANTASYAVTGTDARLKRFFSFVGVSAAVTPVTGTTLTLTEPAGVQDGDLLVACIASRTTATTAISNTGWTAVNSQNNNNTLTSSSALPSGTMLYQIRSGTPDLTFTLPAGISVGTGFIVAYSGHASTSPLDTSTAVTTGTAITSVSVTGMTTTQANDLLVAMTVGGQEAAWSSFNSTTPSGASGATATTQPLTSGWTERADQVTTSGADTSIGIFDCIKLTAGATGNLTATASVSAGHVVIAGAFKIAPSTAKTISAGTSSYAVTGTDATPKLGRKVIATAPASYALTGTDATVVRSSTSTAATNVATASVGDVSVTAIANVSVDISAGLLVSTASVNDVTVSTVGAVSVNAATNLATASAGDVTVSLTAATAKSSVPINPAAFLPFLVR